MLSVSIFKFHLEYFLIDLNNYFCRYALCFSLIIISLEGNVQSFQIEKICFSYLEQVFLKLTLVPHSPIHDLGVSITNEPSE